MNISLFISYTSLYDLDSVISKTKLVNYYSEKYILCKLTTRWKDLQTPPKNGFIQSHTCIVNMTKCATKNA